MKRLSTISVSLVLLTVLILSFQNTALAASQKGSPIGKQVNTIVPNCPVAKSSSITPLCVPYAPCTKTGCYGIDPYASGCATATTYNRISSKSDPIYETYGDGPEKGYGNLWGYVYNYYSSWCVANWNQVSLSPSRWVQLIIDTTDSKNHFEQICFPDNSCGTNNVYEGEVFPAWTNMIDGTNVTSACAWVSANGGGLECANL